LVPQPALRTLAKGGGVPAAHRSPREPLVADWICKLNSLLSMCSTAGSKNNAARDDCHATEEVTPEHWDERFAVNLKHQFFAAVLPDMTAAKWGSMINFGSSSWMVGQGGMVAYTACKSAILGLTRSIARDFGPYNIRVNAIAPGWILTERRRKLWLNDESYPRLMERRSA
jgi:NAD(P)-dependent dehydrogenase (short-subunit alcohol dehydrogenase family)